MIRSALTILQLTRYFCFSKRVMTSPTALYVYNITKLLFFKVIYYSKGNCSNHGGCFIKQKVLYCSCDANYTGSTCSTNLDPCFYSPCLNNGTCVSNMTGVVNTTLVNYTCECSYPFSGSNCEIKADVCINTTCSHNGACVSNSTNQPECKCFYLFSGTNCETMSNKKKTITTVVAISSILAIIIIVTFYTIIVLMDLDTLFRKQRARRFKLNAPKRKTVRFQYIA